MSRWTAWLWLACLALVSGCAVGNKYDYRSADVALPIRGERAVGLAVCDQRAYVLDGSKQPDFIGLQRGGFGNPFDVRTASGAALTADMRDALLHGLQRAGFTVTTLEPASCETSALAAAASGRGVSRAIALEVKEWKSDAMVRLKLSYDLTLRVLDDAGRVLATSRLAAEENVGGAGFASQNESSMAATLARKLSFLFAPDDVKQALEH